MTAPGGRLSKPSALNRVPVERAQHIWGEHYRSRNAFEGERPAWGAYGNVSNMQRSKLSLTINRIRPPASGKERIAT